MDCQKYTTIMPERERGQHLQREDRGAIQSLVRQGLSGRAIAKELNCSPTTISNELKRGTPPRKSNKGRAPGYSAKRGEAVYRANRTYSKKPHKIAQCTIPRRNCLTTSLTGSTSIKNSQPAGCGNQAHEDSQRLSSCPRFMN